MNAKVCLFLILLTAAVDGRPLAVTLRKLYTASAATQKESAQLDRLCAELEERLRQDPRFEYLQLSSLQQRLGLVLLSDWHRLDAASLKALDEEGLQTVIFFSLKKTSEGWLGCASAYEFPSHVFIEEADGLPLHPRRVDEARRRLSALVQHVADKRTPYGFPVSPPQKGLFFVSDRRCREAFHAAVRLYASFADRLPLVCPVLCRPFDDALQSSSARLGAEALLFLGEADSLYMPPSRLAERPLDNRLPLWPPLKGFTRFSVAAEPVFLRLFAESLFPADDYVPESFAILPHARRALLLRRIRTLREAGDDAVRRSLPALYDRLLSLYDESEREHAWVLLNSAAHLQQSGELEAALQRFQGALAEFKQHNGLLGVMLTAAYSGEAAQQLAQYETAEGLLLEGLAAAQTLPDEAAAAFFQARLGEVLFAADRPLEAWERFDAAVEGYFHLGDSLKVAQLYLQMGLLMRRGNSLLKSREYLEKALRLASAVGAEREAAYAHFGLGIAAKELFEEEATAHFEAAADGLEIIGDLSNLAAAEEHLGDLYVTKGSLREAQRSYEAAARFFRRCGRSDDLMRVLVKCGDTAARRRLYPKAQRLYNQALESAAAVPDSPMGAVILYKKGLAHLAAGELEIGERELKLARETTTVDLENVDGFMENLLRRLEDELNSRSGVQP